MRQGRRPHRQCHQNNASLPQSPYADRHCEDERGVDHLRWASIISARTVGIDVDRIGGHVGVDPIIDLAGIGRG